MKNFIIMLLTLICAAVALPLAAQEDEIMAEADSSITEQVVNIGRGFSENAPYAIERTSVDESSDNGIVIAVLAVSFLSLIISVLSFIQNKKNMIEKDVNASNDIERQISNMQQQLLQMRKLMEEMMAKQSSLLGEFVSKLGTVQQMPLESPTYEQHHQQTQQVVPTSRQHDQTGLQQKCEESTTQERLIYVRPSIEGTNIVLTPVSETYADRATFIIKAFGDKGTYAFNKAATKSVISYLDNMLTPYCDCSLLTNGTVSTVNPTGDGTVEKQGDKWLVINKAQVSAF